jgi:hypothetical protein
MGRSIGAGWRLCVWSQRKINHGLFSLELLSGYLVLVKFQARRETRNYIKTAKPDGVSSEKIRIFLKVIVN